MSERLLSYLNERIQVLETRLSGLPAALEAVKLQVNQQVEALIEEAGLTDRFLAIKAQIPEAHAVLQREADMLKMALAELQQAREEALHVEGDSDKPVAEPEESDDELDESETEEWKLPGNHPLDWRREIIRELAAQGKKPVLPIEDILATSAKD